MNYLKKIQSLESEVGDHLGQYSQYTIDAVQNSELELNRGDEDPKVEGDDLGALLYQHRCVLEIIDRKKTSDCNVLEQLCSILQDWQTSLD